MTTTLAAVKREVSEIQQTINQKFSTKRHVIIWAFSRDDEPHGVYGYHALVLEGGKQPVGKALSLEWELKEVTNAYKEGSNSWQNPQRYDNELKKLPGAAYFWKQYPTLESYLAYRRCKCGRHGVNNDQPFGEVLE
jgi:hypothetical protein